MNILFLTTILPIQANTGSEIASISFINALRENGYTVDVLGYLRPGQRGARLPAGFHLAEYRHIESTASKLHLIYWLTRSLLSKFSYSTQKYISTNYLKKAKELISRKKYSTIIIDHAQMGWIVENLKNRPPFVYLSHNVEGALYKSLSTESKSKIHSNIYTLEAHKISAMENRLLHSCAQCWTLSEKDSEQYRSSATECTPKIFTFHLPSQLVPGKNPIAECDLALIGTWSWEANSKGLHWFFEEVYPLINTNTNIRVAGKGADWLRTRYANVDYVGFTPDASTFMQQAKCIAIPSISGAGVQIKTLDAMVLGRQIVATSFAARGISDIPPYLTIADNPSEFADHINRITSDDVKTFSAEAEKWSSQRRLSFLNSIRDALSKK